MKALADSGFRSRITASVLAVAALGAFCACGDDGPSSPHSIYTYAVPEQTSDGWATGHVSDHEIQLTPFVVLFNRILAGSYKEIHSVLILRNGVLVVEEYFPGESIERGHQQWDRDMLHDLHSVTKSFNSAVFGMALDEGMIGDVEDRISSYLPEYADIFADAQKDSIRVKHLLSMTAGLHWDEWSYPYTDMRNTHVAMHLAADQLRYALGLPMVASPGEEFLYNSALSITLGRIVHNATGLRPDEFAERYLFGPLGISDYYWWRYPDGTVQTGGGLYLRPRDMAKFGQLFLNGGRWGDRQIISEGWIEESVNQQAPDSRYGYQWWLEYYSVDGAVFDSFSARGRGGQYIFVFPDLDLIAVFTGGNDNQLALQPEVQE
jgi:CubicO group peptidase (beta-lactamase class C family)